MRILFIHPHIFAGGAEKAIVYLAHHLNLLGHESAICTLSTRLDELPPLAQQVQYLTPHQFEAKWKFEDVRTAFQSVLTEVKALRQLTREHLDSFDLLAACNFPAYWSTYGYQNSKPLLWISSEVFGPFNISRDLYNRSRPFRFVVRAASCLDRQVVRRSVDAIVTCSELNRTMIKKRYNKDAKVIPTGVDCDFFGRDYPKAKEELGLEDSFVLLHVGALVERKNQILSIRALHQLKAALPSAQLILVGEGPWESSLRQEAKQLGLSDDVIFAGHVTEEKLRLYYNASNVNLYPVEDQTYGLVPFEAMAAGKPSLVSENSGAGILMAQQQLEYLIRPETDSICKSVLRSYHNPEETRDIVQRGRAFTHQRLSWERYAIGMVEVFKSLIGGKMAC